jgi:ribosomal protein L32
MEPIKIKLPNLMFKKECPQCHQMWLTFPGRVCPECETIKTKPLNAEIKKVTPDPVVGENDAIDQPFRADINGD